MKRIYFAVCGVILFFGLIGYAKDTNKPRINHYSLTLFESENPVVGTILKSINEPKSITGYEQSASNFMTRSPFEFRHESFTALPGSFVFGWACSQNNDGDVVGMAYTGGSMLKAVLWNDGVASEIGPVRFTYPVMFAEPKINNLGQIIVDNPNGTSYVWNNGAITVLAMPAGGTATSVLGINDDGWIVGAANIANVIRAILWIDGVPQVLDAMTYASAINNRGQITGWIYGPTGAKGILSDNGAIMELGKLDGFPNIWAKGINNSTQIVGSAFLDANAANQRAFIWDNGKMYDLNLMTDQESNVNLISAEAINEQGYIVGTALKDSRTIGFLLKPER